MPSLPAQQTQPRPVYAPPPPGAGRWWAYVAERRLCCGLGATEPMVPSGHHIRTTFDTGEDGVVMCTEWIKAERRECGLWIYIFNVRGGRSIIARLTDRDEWTRSMKHLAGPSERLDYLGIFAPPAPRR